MQVKLYLLTVVEDGAGNVVSESRQPLPAVFQSSAVFPAPELVRLDDRDDQAELLLNAPRALQVAEPATGLMKVAEPAAAPTPMQEAAARARAQALALPPIPLAESDPDVLEVFGKKAYHEQRSRPVMENGQPVLHARRSGGSSLIPLDGAVFGDGDDD